MKKYINEPFLKNVMINDDKTGYIVFTPSGKSIKYKSLKRAQNRALSELRFIKVPEVISESWAIINDYNRKNCEPAMKKHRGVDYNFDIKRFHRRLGPLKDKIRVSGAYYTNPIEKRELKFEFFENGTWHETDYDGIKEVCQKIGVILVGGCQTIIQGFFDFLRR